MRVRLRGCKLENGLKTVKDLFDGAKIFKVPIYQRAYSWSDKQLSDFVEDIKNQKLDRTYFLGTVLLEKAKNEGDFRGIGIVDGQQRITTMVIFMKVLLDLLKKNNQDVEILQEFYIKYKNRFKLKLQDEDAEFFQTYILEDAENPELLIKRPSQQKLLSAKQYFYSKLSNLSLSELLEIKDKINKTKVLTYSVEDNAEATLIFETTNDRGKPLTNLEKIKSFLMYKCYLASEESADILKSIYQRFSDIYNIIETIDVDKEDNILQYHFVSYENWANKRDYQEYVQMIKNNINQLLLDKKDKEVINYIENYTKKLRESFFTISEIQKSNLRSLKEVFLLSRLGIIFYPLMIKAYQFDKSENKKEFEDVTKLIEIFSFRVLGMKAKRSSDLDSAINIIVRDFQGDFKLLKIQLVEKILEYCSESKFKEKLNSTDFYNDFPGDRVYLFWQYENHLRELNGYSPMSYEEYLSKDNRYQLTIEHIAPQNPEETKNRIVTTENCDFSDYTSDEFKENYLHCVGNITFDPRSANSSKGRKSIEEKDSKYFRRAPFMTQNELGDFLENGVWAIKSINNRKEKIIKFALDQWNPLGIIDIESYNEYLKKKESKEMSIKKVNLTEEHVKKNMGSEAYLLLQEFRRELKKITPYDEKINQYFIGLKNGKNYFAVINWRQGFLYVWVNNVQEKDAPKSQNLEYFPKYEGLAIKIYSKEDIEKYSALIKLSNKFKK